MKKNRADRIWSELSSSIQERGISDVLLVIQQFDENSEMLMSAIRSVLLECDEKTRTFRQVGEKSVTSFIAFSFLDSSVLTGAFDIRVDFYDSSFLSDIAEVCAYLPYSYLKPIYQESVDAICAEASKKFVRFMDYEKDEIAAKYRDEVLYNMVISVCSLCLLHPDMTSLWQELTLADDCFFTFGRFLNDQQLFLRVPKQKVVALR